MRIHTHSHTHTHNCAAAATKVKTNKEKRNSTKSTLTLAEWKFAERFHQQCLHSCSISDCESGRRSLCSVFKYLKQRIQHQFMEYITCYHSLANLELIWHTKSVECETTDWAVCTQPLMPAKAVRAGIAAYNTAFLCSQNKQLIQHLFGAHRFDIRKTNIFAHSFISTEDLLDLTRTKTSA